MEVEFEGGEDGEAMVEKRAGRDSESRRGGSVRGRCIGLMRVELGPVVEARAHMGGRR